MTLKLRTCKQTLKKMKKTNYTENLHSPQEHPCYQTHRPGTCTHAGDPWGRGRRRGKGGKETEILDRLMMIVRKGKGAGGREIERGWMD